MSNFLLADAYQLAKEIKEFFPTRKLTIVYDVYAAMAGSDERFYLQISEGESTDGYWFSGSDLSKALAGKDLGSEDVAFELVGRYGTLNVRTRQEWESLKDQLIQFAVNRVLSDTGLTVQDNDFIPQQERIVPRIDNPVIQSKIKDNFKKY